MGSLSGARSTAGPSSSSPPAAAAPPLSSAAATVASPALAYSASPLLSPNIFTMLVDRQSHASPHSLFRPPRTAPPRIRPVGPRSAPVLAAAKSPPPKIAQSPLRPSPSLQGARSAPGLLRRDGLHATAPTASSRAKTDGQLAEYERVLAMRHGRGPFSRRAPLLASVPPPSRARLDEREFWLAVERSILARESQPATSVLA